MAERIISEEISAFKPVELGNFLGAHNFRVPPYQRPYAWEKDQIDEFWDDLMRCVGEGKEHHFIGPMFMIGSRGCFDKRMKILDGQQRLVTSEIIFRALHDFLVELCNNSKVTYKINLFGQIGNYIKSPPNNENRVECNRKNVPVYEFLMRDNNAPFAKIRQLSGQTKSDKTNKKLKDAYKIIIDKLLELSGIEGKKDSDLKLSEEEVHVFIDTAEKIFHAIRDKFYLLDVSLNNEELASEIFETLNQRGEKLMFIDLFKNTIFDKFGSVVKEDFIVSLWEELLSIADNEESNVKEFLRYYWLSSEGFIGEKSLFRSYKQAINSIPLTKRDLEEYFRDKLIYEAKIFFAFSNSSSEIWPQQDIELKKLINELKYLGFRQQMPLLLSIYVVSGKSNSELKKSLKVIINFLVKRQIFLQRNPNEYEKKYSEWALQIRRQEKTICHILTEIKNKTPEKGDILKVLSLGVELKRSKYSKYVLIKINDSLDNSGINNPWDNYPTLEHICPQTQETWWKRKISEDKSIKSVSHIINRLGNHTLLGQKDNSELGNISFEDKVKKYLALDIPINNFTIKQGDTFSMDFIEEREKRMKEIIDKNDIWEN